MGRRSRYEFERIYRQKLTCVLSKGLKEESFYHENEFIVKITEDAEAEEGYSAIVSGYDQNNEYQEDEWSPKVVWDNLSFQNWVVVKKNNYNKQIFCLPQSYVEGFYITKNKEREALWEELT